MKKLLLLVFAICLFFNVSAQKSIENIKYEGSITFVMDQNEFLQLKYECPSKLLNVYYDINYFCYISNQLPEGTRVNGDYKNFVAAGVTCDDEATLINTKQINHRKYTLIPEDDEYVAYSIGNTGFYIIVNPLNTIKKNRIVFMKEYGF